ncbi:MAG: hypothetical protein MUC96_28625, partial [Myxococcaceae bacterium]|nr:hypothetical protein [Myxococcaceae bacterium]
MPRASTVKGLSQSFAVRCFSGGLTTAAGVAGALGAGAAGGAGVGAAATMGAGGALGAGGATGAGVALPGVAGAAAWGAGRA